MKNKHLAFVLAVLMSMAASVASAHDFEVDGIYYNITSSSSPYTVAVTYRGTSFNSYSDRYTGSVTIPEAVTYNSTTYSVTSIGEGAFEYCSGLTSVTIPNSVTSIGSSAFSETAWYDNQPDGLVYAGKVAYRYKGTMPKGTSIVLEESTVSITGYAFAGCSGLTSITIPNSVTSIGDDAFVDCTGLTSITIPNSVTSIGEDSFRFCDGLSSITIGNSVTSIGNDAFYCCWGLRTIVVNSGNTVYDSREGCNAIIETASNTLIVGCRNTTIPNNVTTIGDYAFYYCRGLTSVAIPNSVTSIGDYAFLS